MKKMDRNRLNQGAGSSPEFGACGGEREPRDLGDAALASRGDVAAFSRLVEAHSGLVRGVALRVMGVEDAEDACQEVWVRVWLNIARFRGDSAFTTWLYRVATNTCLGLRRARLRRPEGARSGEAAPHRAYATGRSSEPEVSILNAERREEMATALGRIRTQHRAALVLRHAEGLSYAEIAGLLNIPDGTAKGWVNRGRAAMLLALTEKNGTA
jgi:RNA polymerase sigma-70 factor, ECF subfamily